MLRGFVEMRMGKNKQLINSKHSVSVKFIMLVDTYNSNLLDLIVELRFRSGEGQDGQTLVPSQVN